MATTFSEKYLSGFVSSEEYEAMRTPVKAAHDLLHNGTGLGNDFTGWLTLPTDYDKEEFARIKAAAEKIKKNSDILIVIGIDRKSTRLNSSHIQKSRMPSSA